MRLLLSLALLCAFAVACGEGGPPRAKDPGTTCDPLNGELYTCSQERDAVLVCNDSNLWTHHRDCATTCELSGETWAQSSACCEASGENRCFPEGSSPADGGS